MSIQHLGKRIEDLHCNGFATGETLTSDERQGIIEFTRRFEECAYATDALEAMADKDLIASAYWTMADYASGQV